MGTPPNPVAWYDAIHDWAGHAVGRRLASLKYLKPWAQGACIALDVGAGWGKYALHNPDWLFDACEIWKPNIDENHLEALYRKVFHADAYDLVFDFYDVIVMGDVLEHMSIERAQAILGRWHGKCREMYVIVPYEMEQHEEDGNVYEVHVQDDLTEQLMRSRYPQLVLEETSPDGRKGLYVKNKNWKP